MSVPETKDSGPAGAVAMQQAPKLCPILSVASIMGPKQTPQIMGLSGRAQLPAGPGAVACQGQGCMWFMPVVQDGKIIDGNCCISLLTHLAAMANDTIFKAGSALAPAAFAPPAEKGT